MPNRITTYKQAFEGVLGIKFDDKVRDFVDRLEFMGHNEHGICFSIWKTQAKLLTCRTDPLFYSILENEIKKWSWPKDDPRWLDKNARRDEEAKVDEMHYRIEKLYHKGRDCRFTKDGLEEISGEKIGCIYFFQGECGGPIKIGYSLSPRQRLKELQTGYPDLLKVLAIIRGTEKDEKEMHERFAKFRLRGEWFRPDAELLAEISALKEAREMKINLIPVSNEEIFGKFGTPHLLGEE